MDLKVHKVELMVFDFADFGIDTIVKEIESDLLSQPEIMDHKTVVVKWDNDSDLMIADKRHQAYHDLFRDVE